MSQPVGAIVQQGEIVEEVKTLAGFAICGRQKPPSFSAGLEFGHVIALQKLDTILFFGLQLTIHSVEVEFDDLRRVLRENIVFLFTGL